MRAVIQRSLYPANVKVNGEICGEINKGLVIYLGVEDEDSDEDITWLARKIVNMRIFNDEDAKMNLSLQDIQGSILLVSQFTLYASTKKGNRPSFIRSAKAEFAEKMYEQMKAHLKSEHNINTQSGIFGADMKVSYINDGPVTIIIDSKQKE